MYISYSWNLLIPLYGIIASHFHIGSLLVVIIVGKNTDSCISMEIIVIAYLKLAINRFQPEIAI